MKIGIYEALENRKLVYNESSGKSLKSSDVESVVTTFRRNKSTITADLQI